MGSGCGLASGAEVQPAARGCDSFNGRLADVATSAGPGKYGKSELLSAFALTFQPLYLVGKIGDAGCLIRASCDVE